MSEALTREQVERHCSRLMAGEPFASHVWLATDAALRQEIERLRHQIRDTANERNQAEQERDRLQHTVEEQRATITYLEGLRHE